jgi:hypothetical protein
LEPALKVFIKCLEKSRVKEILEGNPDEMFIYILEEINK